MNSADQAAMKRPATTKELTGDLAEDRIPQPSSRNDLSLATPGIEPRTNRKTYMAATWDGITDECNKIPAAGQYPQPSPPFAVYDEGSYS